MPSPGEDIYSWSPIAINNGNADPLINWIEHQSRASVNNSARGNMAAVAKVRDQLNGSIVSTGTANAQQFLSGSSYTAIPTGMLVRLKVGAGLSNTGPMTLNMDGIGAVQVTYVDGSPLKGGEFRSAAYTDLIYNGTSWVFLYSSLWVAPINSPVFTGDPQAPNPPVNDRDNSIATTQWVYDFVNSGTGIILSQQVFTTPGSSVYTPSPGMACCIIECIGAGGGGGNIYTSLLSSATNMAGCGGGGGGFSRKLATIADIGATQTVIVGAGGIGGAAGSSPAAGTAGGATSVGTLCVANGGEGGGSVVANAGQGGAPGTGDVKFAGNAGHGGIYNVSASTVGVVCAPIGNGGAGPMGGGSSTITVSNTAGSWPGSAGGNWGAGGSGAVSNQGFVAQPGGNGAAGAVIITEFAGRGKPGETGPIGPVGPVGPTGSTGPAGPAGGTFPDAPSDGTTYGRRNAAWTAVGGAGAIVVGATPPASPTGGTLWWDSNSGQLFIWYDDGTSQQWVVAVNFAATAPTLPTQQIFTSGSGTYTTPAGCRRIETTLVGGGAGGAGGNSGGLGTNGGNTTFGTLTAGGATATASVFYQAGTPGTATGGNINIAGGSGTDGMGGISGTYSAAGKGGSSIFGGAGGGGTNRAGSNAAANTGAGGGGGGGGLGLTGAAGGSSGGAIIHTINSPAATYSYAVGAGGTGGTGGASAFAGGNGGSGIIIVKELY